MKPLMMMTYDDNTVGHHYAIWVEMPMLAEVSSLVEVEMGVVRMMRIISSKKIIIE